MEEDDEFGDLYTDVLRLPSGPLQPSSLTSSAPAPPVTRKPAAAGRNSLFGSDDEEDDDGIFYPAPSSGRPSTPPASSQESQPPARSTVPVSEEVGNEDWILGQAPAIGEQPVDWGDEEDEDLASASSPQEADAPSVRDEFRVSPEEVEEVEEVVAVLEAPLEEVDEDELGIVASEGVGTSDTERQAVETMAADDVIGDLDQEPVIPGLSATSVAPSSFDGTNGGDEKVSRSEDLDSDSEDDLQIVLNDDNVGPFGGNRSRGVGVEDEDDEDGEEDLVIVTNEDQQHHHHHQVIEEQEWGDELMQQPPDGERNETLDMPKGNGGLGTIAGGRIGYSSHGFPGQHHSQFKYIRPGAAGMPGGAAAGTGPAAGQVRPPLSMGPLVGQGRGVQKGFHSGYGLPVWAGSASARAYGSGLEFTLPSHKTIFDVDIDGFDERPWRLPGIDTSDFFNFGFDEDTWRNYRKHLEQLRLEATMQSRIRVYESGRSEQDYDPDLPPELAAATGIQDIYSESTQLGKTDGVQADLIGPGRGAVRSQPQLQPTGRAIQVEGGYGERLPSIDTRPPRIRDSDAIIEIVLQDSIDDSITSNGALDQRPSEHRKQEFRGDHKVEDYERAADSEHFDRSLPSYSGRKGDVINRKGPFVGSVDNNAPEGNGILRSPSDVSLQDRSHSRSRSPVYGGDHHGALPAARWTKESSHERYSVTSDQHSNEAVAKQSDKLQIGDDQKEKSVASLERKGVLQMSPTASLEAVRDVILEGGGCEQSDKLALGDAAESEDKGTACDVPVSGETHGDTGSYHAVKKPKLTSRVEQPASLRDGVDSRATHSDNSKAKSGSSKDYLKRREGGEEEVMQHGRSRQIGDLERHHAEEKRSSQRKDDHGRDGAHEMDKCRITSKGREDIYQPHLHMEPHAAHYDRRSEGFERVKERDGSAGGRQRREDDAYGRKGKYDDMKRDQVEEIESRHKNKVMVPEKKGKDEDIHSRKHADDGDWKGHHYRDGTPRQRDRDDNLMSRRETFDELHAKRRKDEEQRRREKALKEDSHHGYRGREDDAHCKRERDDVADHRRREDQARARDKAENHHSLRHRDDNWRQREREDRPRSKQPHEDTQKHKDREEGRGIVRSGRGLEDKGTSGGGKVNDLYLPKDRRRHSEQHKRVDRVEHTRVEHESHEEMHAREYQLSRKGKNSRRDRLSSHIDHPLTASDGGKMYKENSRKAKEAEVREPRLSTGKRKFEDRSRKHAEVGINGTSEQEGNNTSSGLPNRLADETDVQGHNHSSGNHVEEQVASDDDNHVRRGRSKLERWTSHKERDYSNNSLQSLSSSSRVGETENNDNMAQHDDLIKAEGNIVDSDAKSAEVAQTPDLTGKEPDLHLDTVAKLKKRSERFKLPMPGEKETAMTKKSESELSVQGETVADADIKHERPARKRRWSSS